MNNNNIPRYRIIDFYISNHVITDIKHIIIDYLETVEDLFKLDETKESEYKSKYNHLKEDEEKRVYTLLKLSNAVKYLKRYLFKRKIRIFRYFYHYKSRHINIALNDTLDFIHKHTILLQINNSYTKWEWDLYNTKCQALTINDFPSRLEYFNALYPNDPIKAIEKLAKYDRRVVSNFCTIDFSSVYPNLMRSYNMSHAPYVNGEEDDIMEEVD